MSKLSKKVVAVGLTASTAVWLSGAAALAPLALGQTTTSTPTVADLQAQIADLLAKITALQAQLGGQTAASVSFTRNLTVGSTGADVKSLQQWLNANGYPVASSGAGSPGNETTYFGSRTKAAVAKYQAAKGISPAVGYFGPITRGSITVAAPTTTTTTTTTTATTTSTGVEGSLTVKLAALPADLTEVKEGQTDIAAVAYEVKATSNNVTVSRLDLNFNKRPWLSFNSISIWDGSTLLARADNLSSASFNEITASSDYQLRLSGFSVPIKKDETKTITVKFSAPVKTESGSVNVNVTANANSFRGTDDVGKVQDAPNAALTARTVKFLAKTASNLELISDAATPKERYVQVSTTDTTEVELMKFKLKATNADAKLSTLNVGMQTTTAAALSTVVDVVKLYVDNGTTAVAAATPNAQTGSSSFTTLEDKVGVIAKDSTKSFSVRAVVKKMAYGEGEALSSTRVFANGADIVGVDATSFATATITGSDLVAKKAHLVTKGPTLSFKSGVLTVSANGAYTTGTKNVGAGKIIFTAKAFGSAIYLEKYSATAASSGVIASSTTANSSASTTFTFDSIAIPGDSITKADAGTASNAAWYIPQGETKAFEVTQDTRSLVAGFVYQYLVNYKWRTTDADDTALTTTTFGLDDYKTNQEYMEHQNVGG